MKKILVFSLALLLSVVAYSQTASSLHESVVVDGQRTPSLGNPYLKAGAKLSYVINSNADFSENILFNVRFRKDLYSSPKFTLPLVSNLSLGNWGDINDDMVALSDGGVSIGMYPYFTIDNGGVTIVPHFEISAKILPGESLDLSKKRYKAAGNVELHLSKDNGEKNTISAGLFYSNNQNFGEKNMYGVDITSLISLDLGSAFLVDYKKPFNGPGLLSLGIVVK